MCENHKKFPKDVVYTKVLEELKELFLKKWNSDKPSNFGNLEDFEQISTLGFGNFGSVILCEDKKSEDLVAVKLMLKENIIRARQVQNVLNEKRVLRSSNFPFLICLEFSRKDNDCVYLGMPFVNGVDLSEYLQSVGHLDEKTAQFYGAQVLLGLEYLHHNNIIYRDLKPENILIDNKGYIKIIDFGFAKRVTDSTSTLCGTPEYFAPEMINKIPYHKSVDWWTFGLLIYELISGFSPFQTFVKDEVLMFSKICGAQYEIPKKASRDCISIIQNLLQVEVSKRLGCLKNGCNDIKEHSWFNKIEWYAILNKEIEAPHVPNLKQITKADQIVSLNYIRSTVNKFAEHFQEF